MIVYGSKASKNRLICVRPRSVEVFFFPLPADLDGFVSLVEKEGNVLLSEALDAKQMAVGKKDHMTALLSGPPLLIRDVDKGK